jgi:homoserine O-acetyltransferase
MDSHNVARGRGSAGKALENITAKTLVIGIETDILFPTAEQKFLADNIPDAELVTIQSPYGHDGFLTEVVQIASLIERKFLVD